MYRGLGFGKLRHHHGTTLSPPVDLGFHDEGRNIFGVNPGGAAPADEPLCLKATDKIFRAKPPGRVAGLAVFLLTHRPFALLCRAFVSACSTYVTTFRPPVVPVSDPGFARPSG